MDLISRKAVKEQAKASYHVAESMEQLGNLYEDCINALPSAFEGMTNGEVIMAIYPNETMFEQTEVCTYYGNMRFDTSWWNAPYKGVSE